MLKLRDSKLTTTTWKESTFNSCLRIILKIKIMNQKVYLQNRQTANYYPLLLQRLRTPINHNDAIIGPQPPPREPTITRSRGHAPHSKIRQYQNYGQRPTVGRRVASKCPKFFWRDPLRQLGPSNLPTLPSQKALHFRKQSHMRTIQSRH